MLEVPRWEDTSPCTPQMQPGGHFTVTASQIITTTTVLLHEDTTEVCTRPRGHTEKLKWTSPFMCMVPLSYRLSFEAAFFVLSEKHSLLTPQSAPLLWVSFSPSQSCWERYMVGCGFYSSWAASAEHHLQELLRHIHVPFPSRRVGGFYPYFLLPMKFCVKGIYTSSIAACVCPVSGAHSIFISGVFDCLRYLLKTGCSAFFL